MADELGSEMGINDVGECDVGNPDNELNETKDEGEADAMFPEGSEGDESSEYDEQDSEQEPEGEEGYDQAAFSDEMGTATQLEGLSARSRSASSRVSHPGSAVMDLRGSRPNSALVAQEIEGFEDDFMERVEEEEEYEDEAEQEQEEGELGPTVEELIERAQQEHNRLQENNDTLQKKVRLALDTKNKGRPSVARDMSRLDGVSMRYRSSLKQWVDTLEERDRIEAHYQTNIFDMKNTLEERIKRADDINKAYKHFRVEVAKSAEHSKTGRPISDRLLTQLEQEDQEKEEEVQRVRLKNIHLLNQLKRIELLLKQKEELAEGLHLIDFEQLKIENQSLNEKIEERNEELLKLQKKTTTTVQILTHVREKLQFVEKENISLTAELESLDSQLSEKRDKLGKLKVTRDTLRQKGRRIKANSVFITNPSLLDDIEGQKDKRDQVLAQIVELKKEHAALSDAIAKINAKTMALTQVLTGSGAPNAMQILRQIQSQKPVTGGIIPKATS
ncbi:flagellar associated protein [Haematococcus lacustris]